MEAAERAKRLLALTARAAAQAAKGLPAGCEDPVLPHLVRQEAENLFLFVVLSVLLEGRAGQDPLDRDVAAEIKNLLARRIIETKRQAQKLAGGALDGEKARGFSRRLDEAAAGDPFHPYYDSFEKAKSDPKQSPFSVFALRLRSAHGLPDSACQRLLTLSAMLADELVEELHPSRG